MLKRILTTLFGLHFHAFSPWSEPRKPYEILELYEQTRVCQTCNLQQRRVYRAGRTR